MTDIFEKFARASDEEKLKLYPSLVDIIGDNQLPDDTRVRAIYTISLCKPEFTTCLLNWIFSDSDAVAGATMNAIERRHEDISIHSNVNLQHSLITSLFRGSDFEKIRVCQLFGVLKSESFFEYLYGAMMISQSEEVREQAFAALLASDRPNKDKDEVISHLHCLDESNMYTHLYPLKDDYQDKISAIKWSNL